SQWCKNTLHNSPIIIKLGYCFFKISLQVSIDSCLGLFELQYDFQIEFILSSDKASGICSAAIFFTSVTVLVGEPLGAGLVTLTVLVSLMISSCFFLSSLISVKVVLDSS